MRGDNYDSSWRHSRGWLICGRNLRCLFSPYPKKRKHLNSLKVCCPHFKSDSLSFFFLFCSYWKCLQNGLRNYFYPHPKISEGTSKAKEGLKQCIFWFYTFSSLLVRISKNCKTVFFPGSCRRERKNWKLIEQRMKEHVFELFTRVVCTRGIV